jgi:hypothetical protein
MVGPVVPSQFEVGKNKIVHKPTKATFSFDVGHTPSGTSIGDVPMNDRQLAKITERTT